MHFTRFLISSMLYGTRQNDEQIHRFTWGSDLDFRRVTEPKGRTPGTNLSHSLEDFFA